MPRPEKSHDLRLPAWGPYTKRYSGISHIPAIERGLRFDLAVIPGHYRRQMVIPNVKWESGHHAWEASSDLTYYSYRYELEWKDRVYVDAAFCEVDSDTRLVRCEFVNNTDQPQNLMFHLVASMHFPPVRTYSDEPLAVVRAVLPVDAIWVDALDYRELNFATPRATDGLVEDGFLRAEVRAHGMVDGTGIGRGFGAEAGDEVLFQIPSEWPEEETTMWLRYSLHAGSSPARLRLQFGGAMDVELDGTDADEFGFCVARLKLGALPLRDRNIRISSLTGTPLLIDGFALTPSRSSEAPRFVRHTWSFAPEITYGPRHQSVMLHYADTPVIYGLAWDHPTFQLREFHCDDLDFTLRKSVPDNWETSFQGPGDGHYMDIFLRPVALAPHESRAHFAVVCSGRREEVERRLVQFLDTRSEEHHARYRQIKARSVTLSTLPEGETYRFSQERMAATELLNVVYPVYTRRQFIRHHTPGKWWDCLYTWDSGFIGLGLLEIDVERAIDNLNAYLTEAGDEHAAFIHHGSPIPTQIYLFHELWNRTQDRRILERFYPSLRQYYLYLAGHAPSSTIRQLNSQLLLTWEYFFDSGGWDDYPAQMAALGNQQENNKNSRITSSAVTAHVIRSARILRAAAVALGLEEDAAIYGRDVHELSDALQRYAWDGESGYFSFVRHDADGRPNGILRDGTGANYNMGMDGLMPLIAGVCTREQEQLMVERLNHPEHFWTPIGLSTVDQSAPYFRKDGYWNGAVWMPHQWFFWKAALDLGRADLAWRIASTALQLWKNEVETSYYCFEHFLIESGRGAGWHQFGGLSSPVLSWYSAYYRPGRLSTGFNVMVEALDFSAAHERVTARLSYSGEPRKATLICTLRPGQLVTAEWNGKTIHTHQRHAGAWELEVPFDSEGGALNLRVNPHAT